MRDADIKTPESKCVSLEPKSCVNAEVDFLSSPSLVVRTVCVDVKEH